ncbi:MAG: 16S rRNA (adenine(1518)-N(6)/adenine(1519)-N(6))-dimethyltransferase RsmA [Rhizobiales bacterium]|nr:16S rRNA (adenine(1518)-N(6)/adenine(1519)-N(6))-dimethyltransferase RsmA [Hyphomicrobiales bacterium]MBO6698475.1 16S rRNA (adenine(1518)-N(6)/adenine(1519)-N(6))-dimethyltransferase RsmA [Hyphomicrobiales bacterium]MBO6735271.1 16S rRNA (adenine(1518)-N(6)/adenine(1519)-N(6))-dimethyltransferase RsmA [Hyphomicrobiales bacterium]MBO6910921.1 16S rRNA (adenine(1518)-N(6)/adenine(1519)-N(6))-dimethyltransferase RsmA [Hyphomicrobiales bacterium]MBO6955964.1 16S rRNA (adenine(1518)-N(6)/adenine
MNLETLPSVRAEVESLGPGGSRLGAKKSLGQNFLFDLNLTRKIARSGLPLGNGTVVEVGPGPGGLTRALLLEGAKRVIAVERDERFRPILDRLTKASDGRLQVIYGDATKVDLTGHIEPLDGPAQIIANLPYNVGTPLLVRWLLSEPWPPWFAGLTLMFQREVAERIVAQANDKHYGRLGVLANWRCQTHLMFYVPPSAFVPPPKVTSSVVHLRPRAEPLPCLGSDLERVAAAAFGQRRKMVRQSLRSLGLDQQSLAELITSVGLHGTERAETLSIETFAALARTFRDLVG